MFLWIKAVEVTNVSKLQHLSLLHLRKIRRLKLRKLLNSRKFQLYVKQSKFEELKESLNNIGVNGLTVTQVLAVEHRRV